MSAECPSMLSACSGKGKTGRTDQARAMIRDLYKVECGAHPLTEALRRPFEKSA